MFFRQNFLMFFREILIQKKKTQSLLRKIVVAYKKRRLHDDEEGHVYCYHYYEIFHLERKSGHRLYSESETTH
jgi:hypothetical protein